MRSGSLGVRPAQPLAIRGDRCAHVLEVHSTNPVCETLDYFARITPGPREMPCVRPEHELLRADLLERSDGLLAGLNPRAHVLVQTGRDTLCAQSASHARYAFDDNLEPRRVECRTNTGRTAALRCRRVICEEDMLES